MSKQWAIMHDGLLDGDNQFSIADRCIYKKGMTFKQVNKFYINERRKAEYGGSLTDEEAQEEYGGATGCWVVSDKTLKLLEIMSNVDVRNDSACYVLNRTLKTAACNMADKHLGQKVKMW